MPPDSETHIARSRPGLEDLIEYLPDIVLLVGVADIRILGANTAALRAYGYSLEELLSLTIRDLRAPETQGAILGQMGLASAAGARFQTVHLRKNGTAFPVEVSSRGATLGGQRILVSVVRDISELRRMEVVLPTESGGPVQSTAGQGGMEHRLPSLVKSIDIVTQLETTLTDHLAILLATPVDAIDPAIIETQRELCRLLGTDRSAIWQGSTEAPHTLRLTHLCTLDEIPAVPEGITANAAFPWITQQLLAGKTVAIPDLTVLPAEAATDRESLLYYLDRSTLAIPLVLGSGQVRGAISFAATTRQEPWPKATLTHCRLVAQVIGSVLARKQVGEALRDSESQYRTLVTHINIGVFLAKPDGPIQQVNPMMVRLSGYDSAEELLGRPRGNLWADPAARQHFLDVLAREDSVSDLEATLLRRDGSVCPVSINAVVLRDTLGRPELVLGTVEDVSERKRAYEQLELVKTSIDRSPLAAYWFNPGGHVVYVNDVGCQALGYRRDEVMGMSIWNINSTGSPESWPKRFKQIQDKGSIILKTTHRRKDGMTFPVEITSTYFQCGGREYCLGFAVDLTEQVKAQHELNALETQLNQAQRLESVGRLAGGIAHDFNNMLTVIQISLRQALENADPHLPLYGDLSNALNAAERSANLTRQLLAFARKQNIKPRVLDLNASIDGLLRMLRMLLGEHLELLWLPAPDLWPVLMDPSQVDQLLANLCVNSRDAITNVGTVTVETFNRSFDDDFCFSNPGFLPGDYVQVTVSDNGCGMDAQTQGRIFEPFFTTKGEGKGTGLGLATVYGIIKQNNGFLKVASAPQQGTKFNIYLPRHVKKVGQMQAEKPRPPRSGGRETILVVEDNSVLLTLITRLLEKLGYAVLATLTPSEAIRVAGDHPSEIHVLLSDVVMPEMNGRDLAKNVLALRPAVRCLFMSGYTADAIAQHGVVETGISFIQKPFTLDTLASKLREVLGDGPES